LSLEISLKKKELNIELKRKLLRDNERRNVCKED